MVHGQPQEQNGVPEAEKRGFLLVFSFQTFKLTTFSSHTHARTPSANLGLILQNTSTKGIVSAIIALIFITFFIPWTQPSLT